MNQVITLHQRDVVSTGGLEAADRTSRETALWRPSFGSPDQMLQGGAKTLVDARSADTAQNDAYPQSAVTSHQDAIVGARYALNCKPDLKMLGIDLTIAAHEKWYEDFQTIVEARWNASAESDACWMDVARRRTVTEMCRQAIGSRILSGEVLVAIEWDKAVDRPFRTCAHLVSPTRLSNPMGVMDSHNLRGGIETDDQGMHIAYHIRQAHPGSNYDARSWRWRRVPAALPWGRRQIIYITEPLLVEQTRGVGDMAAALPHMRMSKKHAQLALQKAVLGATFAMALESDLPPPEILQMLGAAAGGAGGSAIENCNVVLDGWQESIASYLKDVVLPFYSNNPHAKVDGSQAVVTPPGTTLKMLNADNGGGASYAEFEATLNRKSAAAMNMSYEEFTRDYGRITYSGGKMSAAKTEQHQSARKKFVCDRLAGGLYTLWLEEQFALGAVPLPPTWASRDNFYLPLMKEAICRSEWIGTGKGQIDEMKETQAAILRIKSGLSTYEIECARLGNDFREIFIQRAREDKEIARLGLQFNMGAEKTTDGVSAQSTLQDNTA